MYLVTHMSHVTTGPHNAGLGGLNRWVGLVGQVGGAHGTGGCG